MASIAWLPALLLGGVSLLATRWAVSHSRTMVTTPA
jgi:hypothetical protein